MNKKNKWITLFAVILMACVFLQAQDASKKQKPEKQLIEGEVVDLVCYTSRGASGEGHKSCASRCMTRGTPAGLLDKDGNIFVIIGPSPGYADYAAQTVRLKGNVVGGRISPNKMEVRFGKTWKDVALQGGSPKSE
ncbi:MAG: hypothetical protein HOA15_02380 [Candidatus Marinimicrobia bacterium]|jgi:hypothetical protein|nr:hypothetical protein [Candidatus Neomarinimicrobiota bacterium]MBT3675435.1 hypothetical protein [Candidatus Neomarinimicrobiota bacterium]MBT4270444.1 hypothetical protein [Candidatus Neomarinimicrobiota bacterium]MBT4372602.1 hypothetical protein [Candidatus Neomarinimicrobiota bacterium]MBT6130566.1 hypothetical protein [Candidatus Neomarinimicrobiota bacterium]